MNLVDEREKAGLFQEIFRVLHRGGRVVISDIVSDEPVPEAMRNDPELWSGCISGAMTEAAFLQAFADAGFYGMEWLKFEIEPWRTVEGIEFRSVTVQAWKGKQGPCHEHRQAVVYRGPFKETLDDDGHRYPRGQRIAVCDKTFRILQNAPYADAFAFLEPHQAVPPEEAPSFDCRRSVKRHPRETKGADYPATTEAAECREGDCC